MNLVYGALMLHEAGKDVTEDNLKKLVSSVEMDVDDAQIKALVSALDGVDIDEAVSQAAVTAAPAQAAAPAEGQAEESGGEAEEEAEEEQEEQEEEAAEGLGALFG